MLEVEALDHICDVAEPASIVLIDVSLAPVAVSREVLSDLIHVLVALLLVISPYLSLLVDQVGKY